MTERMTTLGESFNPRSNSLNSIRLFLALSVIIAHSYDIGGFAGKPRIGNLDLASFAVYVFFALSGYLITGSRERSTARPFFRARFLRIYPGFWVCIILTAFVFSAVAGLTRGGWSAGHAIAYVLGNFTLRITQPTIGSTLEGFPFQTWNGSLWTLFPEFLCYVAVGSMLSYRRFRSGLWLEGIFLLTVLAAAFFHFVVPIGLHTFPLFAFFMAGAVVYKNRSRIPMSTAWFLVGLAIIVGSAAVDLAFLVAPIPVAYCGMWLGVRLPQIIERLGDGSTDISYGVYIYAFPMQQLLCVAGVNRFGVAVLIVSSILLTLIPATLSWFMVEKPSLRYKTVASRDKSGPSRP